jgi:hypothetical protein
MIVTAPIALAFIAFNVKAVPCELDIAKAIVIRPSRRRAPSSSGDCRRYYLETC